MWKAAVLSSLLVQPPWQYKPMDRQAPGVKIHPSLKRRRAFTRRRALFVQEATVADIAGELMIGKVGEGNFDDSVHNPDIPTYRVAHISM